MSEINEAAEAIRAEVGDENAPVGSKLWAKWKLSVTRDVRYRVGEDAKCLRRHLGSLKDNEAHKPLGFESFGDMCLRLLHLSPAQVEAVFNAGPGLSVAMVLANHGGDRKSEKAKAKADQPSERSLKKYGETREYLTARLIRDGHHDIAARVDAGEISARAGAIRAGIIRKLSSLEKAQAAFTKLSNSDRAIFISWVNGGKP